MKSLADVNKYNKRVWSSDEVRIQRDQIVQQLVDEYKIRGKQSAIKLFDDLIKKYQITQLGIKTIILEFRKEIGEA